MAHDLRLDALDRWHRGEVALLEAREQPGVAGLDLVAGCGRRPDTRGVLQHPLDALRLGHGAVVVASVLVVGAW